MCGHVSVRLGGLEQIDTDELEQRRCTVGFLVRCHVVLAYELMKQTKNTNVCDRIK